MVLVSTPFASSAPAAIQVDLLAALPTAAARSRSAKKSTPQPARPTPAPPRSKPVVLPKQTTTRATKAPRVKPREVAYGEALSQLREELGESIENEVADEEADALGAGSGARGGSWVDPEVAAWMIATRRHVRSVWVTPPEFLELSLRTEMWIAVAADGSVLGEPRVIRSSGDPFWDDNAARAMLNASPLPPPPMPGEWRFAFTPREDR